MNVVLLGRDTEGKSRYDAKDSEGKPFIQEIITNGAQVGGDFTDYTFPKPNETEPLPNRYRRGVILCYLNPIIG
ncbi:cache domain-containing protein [Desulfosporosinus nitroreducens]|uniref:cache domain-containing protein n=1 Tax=Desulfosporosinus nitroreducens TaxID=2018668 RepID=UPI00207C8AFD|nr:cache domain-containing protein [Desulfosporosinus nitroreducens]MCO1601455.1 cache domain-containing protein [Desulfosporosinus nitroreducens]